MILLHHYPPHCHPQFLIFRLQLRHSLSGNLLSVRIYRLQIQALGHFFFKDCFRRTVAELNTVNTELNTVKRNVSHLGHAEFKK